MHILLKMLGYGVALFSAFCILVFAAILFDGEEDEAGSTIAAIVFFVGIRTKNASNRSCNWPPTRAGG